MKSVEKKKAISLRKKGTSIKEIARILKVAKSSASVWVRNVVLDKKQIRNLKRRGFTTEIIEKRRSTRLLREHEKRKEIMFNGGKSITALSKRELKIIGLCLYWGEGAKTFHGMARVANSDPSVIKVMMRFFREICGVKEDKFSGQVHTYSHLQAKQAEAYWSEISGIPKNQFYKTYIKPSVASKGKRDKLPYGTFDICICNTKLFLEIMGQIEKLKTVLVSE